MYEARSTPKETTPIKDYGTEELVHLYNTLDYLLCKAIETDTPRTHAQRPYASMIPARTQQFPTT